MGLEKTLRRFFPIDYDPNSDPDEWARRVPGTVRLISHEVGTWICLCGKTTGLKQRYKYACKCGAIEGTGRITADTIACMKCGLVPYYTPCFNCGTRVGPDLLRQARSPGAHPSVYRVSVTVNLAVERSGQPTQTKQFTLINIPVPLGLREREDAVI